MKKIAIFNYDLNIGGIQKSLINLLNNIDYQKYQIDLYLFEKEIHNKYKNIIPKDVNIIFLHPHNMLKKVINCMPFNLIKAFIKIDVKKTYDYAIDYDSYQAVCASGVVNLNAKKRIMWIHNNVLEKRRSELKYRIYHFFMKPKYQYFDMFVGVSKGVIEPFKKVNHKTINKEFMVIENYIDTMDILAKSRINTHILVNENKYNLISVGRLVHQKGYDLLIKEFNKVVKKSPLFHLYIIGDGPKKCKIKHLIKKYQLENNITLLGECNNPYNIMKLMNGFVLMSRYEGQGIVILEAKALGLDIFIPEHLTQYVDKIKGCKNISEAILKAKKKNNHFDNLASYNQAIIKNINNLFRK